MAGPTQPERILATLRRAPPDGVLLRAGALRRPGRPRTRRPTRSGLRADVRLGRRGPAAERLRPLPGPLRPGDRRRHRLDRDAAHLLLEPPGRRSSAARPARRCPATSCASSTRTAGASRAPADRQPRGRAATRAPPSTGISTRRPRRACAATGSPPATATSAARTASTCTWDASTTCSRSAASGSRRSTWSTSCVDAPAVARRRRGRRHARRREPDRRLSSILRPDEPRHDELAEELRAWCKERLRRYEYPHLVALRRRAATHPQRQGAALQAARAVQVLGHGVRG